MKKAKRATAAMLAAATLISCMLGGCSKASTASDNTSTKTLMLSWWGNEERLAYTMDGVKVFENKNKDISVNCKYGVWAGYIARQNIFMLSHEAPDVMLINYDWISKYSPDGDGFYDIYKLKDNIDLSNFSDEQLKLGESNGKLNGVLTAMNAWSVFLNKDIYDKYNIEIPQTWDDYFAAAKIMNKDNIYPISMGDKALFFFLLAHLQQTTDAQVCDEDGNLTLTKDDIKYMLQFYNRLYKEGVLLPANDSSFVNIASGDAAGIMRWTNGAQQLFGDIFDYDANIVVAPYPKAEGAKRLGWYIKPATLYAISADTEEPEAAAKLVNFLVNDPDMAKLQGTEKGVPASKAAIETLKAEGKLEGIDYKATELMLAHQDEMELMNPILENQTVLDTFFQESKYYILADVSIDEVADKIYNSFYKPKE